MATRYIRGLMARCLHARGEEERMRLSYFVFTNGEEGVNILDWGVKHSSAILGDRKALNDEYTSLLSEFGMSPSLNDTIPAEGKVNILLIPRKNGSVLLGFVFPSIDHKQRPSNSSVICIIPDSLQDERVREIARRIWDSNDIPKIAARGTPRPDSLEFDDSPKSTGIYPFTVRDWPGGDTGYFSVGSNIRKLERVAEETPEPEKVPPEIEIPGEKRRFPFVAVIAVVAVFVAGAFGVNSYMANQRRIAEEKRIAQEIAEQQRLNEERIAREKQEEAQRVRDNNEQELSRLERSLNEAENYLADESYAISAKDIASSVISALGKISDVDGEFSIRIAAVKSRATTITSRADGIIRSAEEARIRQAEEAERKRKQEEQRRAKRITDSIIAKVKGIPGITRFQLESADNLLPPSGNEIDTPLGKMKVCRADDDYSFLDAEALKEILMSFCGDKYVSNIPEESFVFQFNGTKSQWDNGLNTIESKIFLNTDSIKPSRISNPLDLEEYISSSNQHNFRLFFRGEDEKYIVVCVSSSGSLDIYLGAKGNIQPAMRHVFMRGLREMTEINERSKSITFYLKHKDERLKDSDTDGKFELWINQLTNTGGTK